MYLCINKKEDYTWRLPTTDGHKVVYTGNYIKTVTFPSSLHTSNLVYVMKFSKLFKRQVADFLLQTE